MTGYIPDKPGDNPPTDSNQVDLVISQSLYENITEILTRLQSCVN